MSTNEVADVQTEKTPEVKKVNYFFDFYNVRVPFLSNHNIAYFSISPKHLTSVQNYEEGNIREYGERYKSIIYDKERPLIRVKYDPKSKYFDQYGVEKPFDLHKQRYKKVTLQAKNVYINEDICTTHWRIHNIIETRPPRVHNQTSGEPLFVSDT